MTFIFLFVTSKKKTIKQGQTLITNIVIFENSFSAKMYLVKFSEISLSQDIVQRQLLNFDICVSHQQLKNLRVFAYRKIYLAKIS